MLTIPKPQYFVEFKVVDGQLIGVDITEQEYKIKEIFRSGVTNDTHVTYYNSDGEEETVRQK